MYVCEYAHWESITTIMQDIRFLDKRVEREAIHSGQFMVSHFEAEEQDDEDDVAVPVPETEVKNSLENIPEQFNIALTRSNQENGKLSNQQLSIETNLSKLFQCMSLAYRQKLTSPKWNRFRGIKLRWKDKIRLNNVIWRCWHMQFIMKQNTLICQFASPLDVDTHNKPEAIVLEGKYWKRKLQAVTAEYKKWRMFYRNQALGCLLKDPIMTLAEREALNWNSQSNDGLHMMIDEDYMDFMSDTLFSTISNQPFAFPDSREIARAGLADFIQPSLGPLQPNLEDFMDTFEPLNEFINAKLPPVPEEQSSDMINNTMGWAYSDLEVMAANTNMQVMSNDQYQSLTTSSDKLQSAVTSGYNNEIILGLPQDSYGIQNSSQQQQQQLSSYHSSVINKTKTHGSKQLAHQQQQQVKLESNQYKQDISYGNFSLHQQLSKDSLLGAANIQEAQPNTRGYKFSTPVQPNVKFSNQPNVNNEYMMSGSVQQAQQQLNMSARQETTQLKKDMETGIMKPDLGAVPRKQVHRQRQRSRSTSRDQAPQRPLLQTAVSDPALLTPSTSVLLTQLLTSSNHRLSNTAQSLSSIVVDKHQSSTALLVKREDSSTSHPVAILPAPAPPVTTLIITTPSQGSASGDQIMLNSMSAPLGSPVLDHSSRSQDSPESPLGCRGMLGSPGSKADSPPHYKDQRRVGHIHAEQKRRYNIKNGFDMIHSLIPHLNQNPNTKLSKAAMLQKGADYIRQLRSERNQLKEEMDNLRQQIECLNTSISNCQSMLPATGAPVSRRRDSKMQEMFDEYVRSRTLENWKFWIFSLMIKPLLASYNNFVSTSSLEDLYRSTLHWAEQHCTLVDLRPVVLNSLRYLCTKTDILAEPDRLPEEARQAVMNAKPVYP